MTKCNTTCAQEHNHRLKNSVVLLKFHDSYSCAFTALYFIIKLDKTLLCRSHWAPAYSWLIILAPLDYPSTKQYSVSTHLDLFRSSVQKAKRMRNTWSQSIHWFSSMTEWKGILKGQPFLNHLQMHASG